MARKAPPYATITRCNKSRSSLFKSSRCGAPTSVAGAALALLVLSSAAATAGCNSGNANNAAVLGSADCQASAVGVGTTAVGEAAEALGLHSTAIGAFSDARAKGVTALGSNTGATGSATVGEGATMLGTLAGRGGAGVYSVAIGAGELPNIDSAPQALGGGSIAIGAGNAAAPGARAQGAAAVAIGNKSIASGEGFGSAFGYNAHADVGLAPTAIGTDSTARGTNAAAFGRFSSATAEDSTAIGSLAQARRRGAVALGYGSVANVANTVSIGSAELRRRIINVAKGVDATDAVNLAQVRQLIAASAPATQPAASTAADESEITAMRRELSNLQAQVTELKRLLAVTANK